MGSLQALVGTIASVDAVSGSIGQAILETANSVDGHMSALKKRLEDIGTGMGPAATQLTAENQARA